jgi:ABC-type transport system involved in multi-copper enzyme maturation permease subunit
MKKLNTDEREILLIFLFLIIGAFIISFSFHYIEKHQPEIFKTVEVRDVVVAKQSEQESINRFGQFRTNYYILFESGELRKVELKEYMEFNVGDTLTWTETYYK